MIRLRPLDAAGRERLRHDQASAPLSYPEVGQIDGPCPPGYWPLVHRGVVGHGPAALDRARAALDRWAQFPPWVEVHGPAEVGATVLVIARPLGLYTANACRVLARIEGPDRHGLVYGTLPAHVERGEERFLVTLEADGTLRYEVRSFSRPAHPLVWLGFPAARWLQHRFARHSIAALRAAVG